MATIAEDQFDDNRAARTPLTAHRAFPAIVGLWFAALLGFGAVVVPAGVIERLVGASGLAAAIPAAAPPLGSTARILIALIAAVVGAGVGIAIGYRIAAQQARAQVPARVLNALDELGEERLDAPVVTVDPVPAEEAEDDDDLAIRLAQLQSKEDDAPAPDDVLFDLFPPQAELERRRNERRAPPPAPAPGGLERRMFLRREDDTALVFAAPSLARTPDNENFAEPTPLPAWQTEPLDGLGLVQLVERLGASLERRRALLAARTPAEPRPLRPPAVALEPAPAEDAAQAMAAYFSRAEPAPEERLEFEEATTDEADADYGSLLGLRQSFRPVPSGSLAGGNPGLSDDDGLRRALAALERLNRSA